MSDIGTLIRGGKTAYDIVRNSETVINLNTPPFTSVTPQNVSLESIHSWKKATIQINEGCTTLMVRNWPETPMLDVDLFISWLYNGTFSKGGRYISNAVAHCKLNTCVSDVNFNLSASFGNPYNGAAKDEEPRARLPFLITANVVQRQLSIKRTEIIIEWRGEISGAESSEGGPAYSYKREVVK